jgi:hypothetical protein
MWTEPDRLQAIGDRHMAITLAQLFAGYSCRIELPKHSNERLIAGWIPYFTI